MVEESKNNPPPASAPPPARESDPDSSQGSSPCSDSAATRCVVLVCPDGATPVDLLGGLSRRGVNSRVVAEPAEVMLELARQPTGAWVVVDPEKQPGLIDLVEAVRTYHPHTVRWAYQSAHATGKAQLQPLNSQPAVGHADQTPMPMPNTTLPGGLEDSTVNSPSPLGRVQGQVPPDRIRSLIVKVQGPAEVGEPLISEEELAMLLGPVPEEDEGGEF